MKYSDDTIFVGMDLHKKRSAFCVMNKEGEIQKEQEMYTTREDVTKFIKSLGKKHPISIVLEPVSQWYVYVDLLDALGVDVHLAHPRKLKAIATSTSKTDKLDARVLVDHLRTNHLPEAYCSSKKVRGWKEIVRSRSALVRSRTQLKNRIHAVLFKNGLVSPVGTLFTKRGTDWLNSLELEFHFMLSIKSYLYTIDHLNIQIKEIEKEIKKMTKGTKEMKLVKTIPGIGDILAVTIMAEIGEIERFNSYKQLQAYSGLVPWVRNSGGKEWSGHLTKQGSAWLRYAVVEAAVIVARTTKSSDVKDYYLRIKNRKDSKTAAVATARKILAIIWSVLKNEREFKAHYPAI